jgi:hypothetical protein
LKVFRQGYRVNDIRRSISALEDVDTIHDLAVESGIRRGVAERSRGVLNDAKWINNHRHETNKGSAFTRIWHEHTTLQFEQTRCGEGHGGCN